MAYSESNVTCPMTSRDAKWSRSCHIWHTKNSKNKKLCDNSFSAVDILAMLQKCYHRFFNFCC